MDISNHRTRGLGYMVIYADVLFLNQFFMDYLLISLTAQCAGVRVLHGRKVLAGFLGGMYGICMIFPDLALFYTGIAQALCCAGLCAVAFLPCGIRQFLKLVAMSYVISFFLSGALYFIALHLNGGIVKNGILYMQEVWLLFGAVIARAAIAKGIGYIRKRCAKDVCSVEICYNGKHVRTDGFLDTGNGLFDPVSKKPVLLADSRILKTLFHRQCNCYNLPEWVGSKDLKWIPYKTVDGEGVFYGFVAEKVITDGKTTENVIVACCDRKLEHGVLLHDGIL